MSSEWIPLVRDGGSAVTVGSCSAVGVPHIVRAVGVAVVDASRLALYVSQQQGRAVLADVRASGNIAVHFSKASASRAFQFKASNAVVRALRPGEEQAIEPYQQSLVADLEQIGVPAAGVRQVLAYDPADVVVIELSPEEGFNQAPGPRAGTPIGSEARP